MRRSKAQSRGPSMSGASHAPCPGARFVSRTQIRPSSILPVSLSLCWVVGTSEPGRIITHEGCTRPIQSSERHSISLPDTCTFVRSMSLFYCSVSFYAVSSLATHLKQVQCVNAHLALSIGDGNQRVPRRSQSRMAPGYG